MRRILIEIEYDGSNFCGWQKQAGKRSVQGELEKVLSEFLNEEIHLFASGRTDAKVHAKSQFAHFDTNSNLDFSRLILPINNRLSSDVAIKSVKEVDSSFHARYSVMQKTYHYWCYVSKIRSPLKDNYAMQLMHMPDIEKMKQAMKFFVGEKDFTSFCTKRKDQENSNNIRKIFDFSLTVKDNQLMFSITGNGFLHNMVRIIVGTVLEVGEGKRKVEEIEEIFAKKNRIFAGKPAKPNGLFLHEVKYDI